MATWALSLSVVLYLLTAADFAWRGDWAMSVAFACYGIANVAFVVVALR
jgi:hypothetical protein